MPEGLTHRLHGLLQDRTVRQIGTVLVLGISALFVLRAARNVNIGVMLETLGADDIALLTLCCAGYAALLTLLARGWSVALDTPKIDWRQAIAVYGTSVLPKYLPGSVPQYFSRHVLSRRYGWSGTTMAQASVLELALHVLCSLAIAGLLLLWPGSTRSISLDWRMIVVGLAVVAAIAVTAWAHRKFRPTLVYLTAGYQLAFFAGLASLAMVCAMIANVPVHALPTVGGLFLLAWLIGLTVPFAPGGLGVREAAGIAMLSGAVGAGPALFIMMAMRLITIGGDVLMIAAGLACQRSERARA